MKRSLSLRSQSPRQKCIRTQAFDDDGAEQKVVRKFLQVEADLVLIKNSVAQTAADLNLGGTLTRIPSGRNFVTTIELQGERESFDDFLNRLDKALSSISTMPRPYKVIDVPLKEKQKATVKLVEAAPEKILAHRNSDGVASDDDQTDIRVVFKLDSKSQSSVTSSNNIEGKMETLRLKNRRLSVESIPSHSSPAPTDEFME